MSSKNVNYFLMDGTPRGRIKCSINTWTGIVYRIPRTELEKCSERKDLSQSGVYFLFGTSEESSENYVYVGQADVRKNGKGILGRLLEHKKNSEKDYWTEAIVFTTSNDFLGATEISWLESYFCSLATRANRYIVKNGNEPSPGKPTEEVISDLQNFAMYAEMVMGVLGHKVFEPLIKVESNQSNAEPSSLTETQLFLERKSRKSNILLKASCVQTSEGFVVKQGSMIETIDSHSIPIGIKEKRKYAISDKKIDREGILQVDMQFNSPSYAAAFVIGGHANGLTEWKTADGITLKEIEQSEVTQTNA